MTGQNGQVFLTTSFVFGIQNEHFLRLFFCEIYRKDLSCLYRNHMSDVLVEPFFPLNNSLDSHSKSEYGGKRLPLTCVKIST